MVGNVLSPLISLLAIYGRKTISKDSKKTQVLLRWIQGTFGFAFFIAKMDGNQFETLLYSVFNLSVQSVTPLMFLGGICLAYYTAFVLYQAAAQLYLAHWIRKVLEERKEQTKQLREQMETEDSPKKWWRCEFKRKLRIVNVLKIEESHESVRGFMTLFKDYQVTTKLFHLLGGFFSSLKNVLHMIIVLVLRSHALPKSSWYSW